MSAYRESAIIKYSTKKPESVLSPEALTRIAEEAKEKKIREIFKLSWRQRWQRWLKMRETKVWLLDCLEKGILPKDNHDLTKIWLNVFKAFVQSGWTVVVHNSSFGFFEVSEGIAPKGWFTPLAAEETFATFYELYKGQYLYFTFLSEKEAEKFRSECKTKLGDGFYFGTH